MTPIVVAVGAVIRRHDTVLLVQRGREPGAGQWSLPGGRVERGERLREGTHRELLEEIGVDATIGALIGVVERTGPGYHYVIADYDATVPDDAEPLAGDDAEAVAWVPLRSLGEWELVEGLSDFFADHGIR